MSKVYALVEKGKEDTGAIIGAYCADCMSTYTPAPGVIVVTADKGMPCWDCYRNEAQKRAPRWEEADDDEWEEWASQMDKLATDPYDGDHEFRQYGYDY
jgi:hypothetical protein